MRLTPLKIQLAIIKAFYKLAIKSVKYYGGLVGGVNNTCLFKEIRLLRAYIDILRNFTIVGSTITCSCCVEGDYTVLLNDLSEVTETKIQFGCDNSGSMYYNNTSYPFIYFYDHGNQRIEIKFTTILDSITDEPIVLNLINIVFTENCSFNTDTISPVEVAIIAEIEEPAVTVNNIYGNWGGNITIYDGVTVIESLNIPANIMNDTDAIVKLWNTTYPNWTLYYDGTNYVVVSAIDNTDYTAYSVEFSQYEGGNDPSPTGILSFRTLLLELNGVDTQGKIYILNNDGVLYEDTSFVNYLNIEQIVDVLNANCQPFIFEYINSGTTPNFYRIQISPPENSFAFYNTQIFEIQYNYEFDEVYTNWVRQSAFFQTGVNPTLVPYSGTFEEGNIGPFVNDNPCEETTAEQECLSNNDVSKIIAHIDKLVR